LYICNTLKFSDIYGHVSLKKKLVEQVNNNRISHAQLFYGNEGSNALPMAIAYAQYINCTNKQEFDSCGTCPSCNKYQQYIHPDLHFSFPYIVSKADDIELCDDILPLFRKSLIESPQLTINEWIEIAKIENKTLNIPIKECRNIIKKLSFKPYEAEYKVVIMWLPEFVGKEGNVLLKSIEEPAPNTLFILVTENPTLILPTILSRTQLLKINLYSREEIKDYLITQLSIEESVSNNIALMTNGNIHKAKILSEKIDYSFLSGFKTFLNDCYQGNSTAMFNWAESFSEKGKDDAKHFLNYILELLRYSLIVEHRSISTEVAPEEEKIIVTLSKLLNLKGRETIYKAINQAFFEIDRNGNLKFIIINLSLSLKNNFLRQPKAQSN
jgi:DNA polymerase III subunit delta'